MDTLNQILLILHFLGLALGLSVPLANAVMGGLLSKATPSERTVLSRFPPRMSRVGRTGLALLWLTGLALVFTKWTGFGVLPWQFHVKLTAVVLLTLTVVYVHRQEQLIRKGDAAAAHRLEIAGKLAAVFALVAVVFAVLTFD